MDSLVPAWYRAGGAVQICAAALLYMLCSGGRGVRCISCSAVYTHICCLAGTLNCLSFTCTLLGRRLADLPDIELVSDTPDGINGPVWIVFEFLPQPFYVNINGPGIPGKVISPDIAEKLIAGENLVG